VARRAVKKRIWFAIGNPLRGDDGVAQRTLRLARIDSREIVEVQQLTPEVACELEDMDRAVFVDADATADEVRIEPVRDDTTSAPWGHRFTPEAVVALAREHYGFRGSAFVCRVPAREFPHGETLSPEALAAAEKAAQLLRNLAR
jgi:hydrogenase maturation protease